MLRPQVRVSLDLARHGAIERDTVTFSASFKGRNSLEKRSDFRDPRSSLVARTLVLVDHASNPLYSREKRILVSEAEKIREPACAASELGSGRYV
jgi:hypothetical protein